MRLRQRAVAPAKRGQVTPPPVEVQRLTISGSDILFQGAPIQLRGVNQGSWGEDQVGDAALYQSFGSNSVRIVFRWWGLYGNDSIESRDDTATSTALIKQSNINELLRLVTEARDANQWVILAFDSNCGQNGAQNLDMAAYCTIGGNQAQNFFNNLPQRALFINAWKYLAGLMLSYDKIGLYEIMPEPLDGYDATFADDVRDFNREVIAAIRTVDTRTPFLVGPYNGYNIKASPAGYLPERTDCVYTGNMLNPVMANMETTDEDFRVLESVRIANNVPLLVQQAGRKTIADPSLDAMRNSLSMLNANNTSYTWWQGRQNTSNPDEYALYYKNGTGGWTPKTNEISALGYYMTQTLAAVESAAKAAATAGGGVLVYADASNVFQDSAGSIPALAAGQPVGKIAPVVGAGFELTQAIAASRPTLVKVANRLGFLFDGVDDFLQGSSAYFGSGDDMVVIVAGIATAPGANRVVFQVGTAAANPAYPSVFLTSAGLASTAWRGDDAVTRQITGTSACTNRAAVFTARKQGADKRLFLNGAQEGSTDTGAVGALASLSRLRLGSASNSAGYWPGRIAMLYFGKTVLTDPQQQAIERLGAYLIGAGYRR